MRAAGPPRWVRARCVCRSARVYDGRNRLPWPGGRIAPYRGGGGAAPTEAGSEGAATIPSRPAGAKRARRSVWCCRVPMSAS